MYQRACALKHVVYGFPPARGRGLNLNPIIIRINWVEWLWENRMRYNFWVLNSYCYPFIFFVVDLSSFVEYAVLLDLPHALDFRPSNNKMGTRYDVAAVSSGGF